MSLTTDTGSAIVRRLLIAMLDAQRGLQRYATREPTVAEMLVDIRATVRGLRRACEAALRELDRAVEEEE